MKNKKVLVGGVIILVTVGILYWLGIIGFWTDNLKNYWEERQDQKYFQELENKSAELERLYKEDTFGGNTPEETWNLFVKALEDGDTDLASEYFVVEKKDEMKNSLEEIIENNVLNEMINDLINNYDSIGHTDANDFRFVKRDKDNIIISEITLILNKETNKWKILEL